jgi:DNA invertase Pin-like site-specific DNA recombinase
VIQAVVYLRISQDREDDRLGVARQREDCLALCKSRGWDVADVLTDDDVSAYDRRKKRPGYQRLLELVTEGTVDAVVAWHPDRLHRSPIELEEFIDRIEASRAQVATVNGGDYDLATPTGRMSARIVGAVARHECEHKGERLRRQRKQAAHAGKYHGGQRAFGYEKNGLSVVEAEAALLREGAARVIGGESLSRIVTDWNDRGLPTCFGKQWRITTLRKTLSGPRVAGLRVHLGAIVAEAQWPAILDRETWDKVRTVLGDPRRRQGSHPAHLLSGLLRCELCGHTLYASRRINGARQYVCSATPGNENCGRIVIAAERIERIISEAVLVYIKSDAISNSLRTTKHAKSDHGNSSAERERKLIELAQMWAAGDITTREWMAARKRLDEIGENAQRAHSHQRCQEASVTRRSADAAKLWHKFDMQRQHEIIASVVAGITIAPANGRATIDRVNIEWRR